MACRARHGATLGSWRRALRAGARHAWPVLYHGSKRRLACVSPCGRGLQSLVREHEKAVHAMACTAQFFGVGVSAGQLWGPCVRFQARTDKCVHWPALHMLARCQRHNHAQASRAARHGSRQLCQAHAPRFDSARRWCMLLARALRATLATWQCQRIAPWRRMHWPARCARACSLQSGS